MPLQLFDHNGNAIEMIGVFRKGDIVRIRTPEECKAERHFATEKCAIAQYANTICRVASVDISSNETLCKLEVIELHDKKYENFPITYYYWNAWALESYKAKEIKDIGEDELTSLFE